MKENRMCKVISIADKSSESFQIVNIVSMRFGGIAQSSMQNIDFWFCVENALI